MHKIKKGLSSVLALVLLCFGVSANAGTLVHEMSHFNVVAGTDDVVYGQSGAINLAYQGPMVKRGPPTDEDWLQLKSAAILSNELDISRAWDLGKKGQYSLSLSQDISYRVTNSSEVLSLPFSISKLV